jgi:diketogulonate reductase-like aldo/keto reductase
MVEAKALNTRVKHIGVSNFTIEHLEEIRLAGLPWPEVNQIEFHAANYKELLPLLDYHREHHIVTAGYSPLAPIRGDNQAPAFLQEIAQKHGASEAQVLLAWCKSKQIVVIT